MKVMLVVDDGDVMDEGELSMMTLMMAMEER